MRALLPFAACLLFAAGFEIVFIDNARTSGLDTPMVFGGVKKKKYILETTGSGVAFVDYDSDGWTDIFLVNGTTLDAAHLRTQTHQSSLPQLEKRQV